MLTIFLKNVKELPISYERYEESLITLSWEFKAKTIFILKQLKINEYTERKRFLTRTKSIIESGLT